ncbi:MAG TPA: hypothetical protein VIV60_25600 [Polyangiaceae bacterium]
MNCRIRLAFAGPIAALFQACTHQDDLDAVRRTMLQASAGQGTTAAVGGQPAASPASAGQAGAGEQGDLTGRTDLQGEPERAGAAGAMNSSPIIQGPLVRGTPILTTQLSNFTPYDQHDRTLHPELIGVDDQVFALAFRFPFGSGNGDRGSAGFFGPTHHPIDKGDLLRGSFWARCATPDPKYEDCRLAVVFEEVKKPYLNDGLELSVHVGQTWTLFSQVFASMKSYAAGDVQLTFQLGYPNQSLEIGPVSLENYGAALTLTQLESVDTHPSDPVVVSADFMSYGNAACEVLVDMAYPFGRATRCSTLDLQFDAPEDSGYQGRSSRSVRERDVLFATFWARCAQSTAIDGSCRTAVVFEETQAPYINAGLDTAGVVVGPDWQRYTFPFVAMKSYDIEQVKFGIRLGYSEQILELGPASVVQYGSEVQLDALPKSYTEDVSTP